MKSLHFWVAVIVVIIGTLFNYHLVGKSDRNFSGAHGRYTGTGAWHK